ncbi:unnamed protein product [Blepharisma stoltei]|uniref:Uncharacterized protein n=1 Tax=Blepharisma stoltei TaxID=1481888 RepID=A0AAU9JS89_9CILI|nr:unnamed protein product [Blepharisma stoltei]
MITKVKPILSNIEELTHSIEQLTTEELPRSRPIKSRLLNRANWNEFISYFPSSHNSSPRLKRTHEPKGFEWDGTKSQSSSQAFWAWPCRSNIGKEDANIGKVDDLNCIVERMRDKMASLLSSQHKLLSLVMDAETIGEDYQAGDLCVLMELCGNNSELHLENNRLKRHLASMKS